MLPVPAYVSFQRNFNNFFTSVRIRSEVRHLDQEEQFDYKPSNEFLSRFDDFYYRYSRRLYVKKGNRLKLPKK